MRSTAYAVLWIDAKTGAAIGGGIYSEASPTSNFDKIPLIMWQMPADHYSVAKDELIAWMQKYYPGIYKAHFTRA